MEMAYTCICVKEERFLTNGTEPKSFGLTSALYEVGVANVLANNDLFV